MLFLIKFLIVFGKLCVWEFLRWGVMIYIISNSWTIVFIIIYTFQLMYIGPFTELQTKPFIQYSYS